VDIVDAATEEDLLLVPLTVLFLAGLLLLPSEALLVTLRPPADVLRWGGTETLLSCCDMLFAGYC
jgi:hypothetical protein